MQRFLTAFIPFTFTATLSTAAFAVDPGTYRPGQPYAATPASTHSQCQAQCKGDAACKGWNFVKSHPRQNGGICEFNSLAVQPIQSQISISANESQVVNPTGQSRIIQAGTRTTRIGSPQPTQKPAPNTSQNAVNKANPQARQTEIATQPRRIIRQEVPTQINPQNSAFRHNLGAAPQRINQYAQPQRLQRRLSPAAKGFAPHTAPALKTTPQQLPRRTGLQPDPRLQQPRTPNQPAPRPQQLTAPRRAGLVRALTGQVHQTPQGQIPTRTQPPQQQYRPLSAEEAVQKSLYGHLNDDVSVPKVLTQNDLHIPNDQAIPTVQSVPVKPVDREAFSGLAGG